MNSRFVLESSKIYGFENNSLFNCMIDENLPDELFDICDMPDCKLYFITFCLNIFQFMFF